MRRYIVLAVGLVLLSFGVLAAQTTIVTGDRSTPLRPVSGAGNVGVSNAVLLGQPEVRTVRVVVDAGGTRVMHAHNDVKFHLFVPITGAMTLDLEGGQSVLVTPWQPYYMKGGTQHGFRNTGSSPVDIIEVFVR
jgi:mannose-6-phosphate isomerase-like protein (cupin superfamily)